MVVFPPSKINIGLYVTDKRDDGYHNIQTLYYPLGLTDILEVVPDRDRQAGSIEITLSGLKIEGPPETNLVVKAYRLLQERSGLPGVQAFLHKCIPAGAGLGGGSSDGASMLLLLNKLFDLDLSYCDLFGLAIQLGSDCPYFLDPVPSFARGRGEELKPAGLSLKGLHLYLYHPGTGISTVSAYKHVEVGEPAQPVETIEQLPVGLWKKAVTNAFEPYAFDQQPIIRLIKAALYRSGAIYASMTGSGSAVYGLFEQEMEIPDEIAGYFIWKEKL